MIPRMSLALNLRRLTSHGTFLPKGIPWLPSGVSLVTLKLTDVETPSYFTPEDLVTLLQHVPQLEGLSVGFSIPTPRPHAEGELLRPTIPFTTLPTFRRLEFRGESTCLESLLSRISAPLLEKLDIALSNELTTPPRLFRIAGTTKGLRHHPVAKIHFNRRTVSFVVRSGGQHNLSLHLSCNHFDSPIHSATQVCSALVPVLSFAEELTLKFEDRDLQPDWRDEVDDIAWHDLLGPFSSVKRLSIGHPFATGFSSAMRCDAELVLGLLPKLQELEAELDITQANTAFAAFVHARQLAGRPVRLSVTRMYPTLHVPFPTRTVQKGVRHDESNPSIPHVAHISIRYRSGCPQRQHPSDQSMTYCTQPPIRSATTFSLPYSATFGWMTKKAGIANSGGASSPTSVENGGISYTDQLSIWICMSL
jgi:hypothetical protein